MFLLQFQKSGVCNFCKCVLCEKIHLFLNIFAIFVIGHITKMSILVHNGQLQRTVNSAGGKLVAVDFSNPNCPPCRAIHPFWESLVSTYKSVIFCTVTCDECPIECNQYQIEVTPTFVFIKNGKEVERIRGANKNAIKAVIEKYKTNCVGTPHTLGSSSASNQGDWFAQIRAKRDLQLQQQQQQQNDKEKQTNDQITKEEKLPKQNAVVEKKVEVPSEIMNDLSAMGFNESQIIDAYVKTNNGDVDKILDYIQEQQSKEGAGENTEDIKEEVQQGEKETQIANDLMKPLTPEGETMKEQLVSMGFDGEMAQMAINVVGYESVDKCIEIIGKIQRGEPIPMPKHKKTQEEIQEKLKHYQELLKQKREEKQKEISPKARAQNEIQRRKQVLDNLEAKKKHEEMQREQAIKDAQKERIREKIEREKVRAKIQAQREQQKLNQNTSKAQSASNEIITQNNTHVEPPAQSKVYNECTLKLIFPDGKSMIAKFDVKDTLAKVDSFIRNNNHTIPRYTRITFEIVFPHQILGSDSFGKTLSELKLVPRAQLRVKY